MATWGDLEQARPDLAEAGQGLLYQFGVGLAFVATIRPDGGPRVHPICPILQNGGLFALIIPSQKRDDLIRDGRYALHSFPTDSNEDAFYVTGRARLIDDSAVRERLVDQFVAERGNMDRALVWAELPFQFDIETVLLTRTKGHGDWEPRHAVWHAPR